MTQPSPAAVAAMVKATGDPFIPSSYARDGRHVNAWMLPRELLGRVTGSVTVAEGSLPI